MDTRDPLFLSALALALWAGAAPPAVCAPGRAVGAEAAVKMNRPVRPVQTLGTPFVLFETPARASRPRRPPIDRGRLVDRGRPDESDGPADGGKSAALTDLLQTIVPPPITVTVRPSPLAPRCYVAVLTSATPVDPAEVAEAVKQAQAAVGSLVSVVSNIRTPDPADPPVPAVTLTYTLRFLRGTLPTVAATDAGTADGSTGTGTDAAATDLAAFLTAVYPSKDTTVTAHENYLVLVGPARHVNALRQMLALSLDVPSPQVKADIYTIQVNTTPRNRDGAQDKIEEIAAGVQIVRDFIHGSQGVLAAYLALPQSGVGDDPKAPDPLKQELFAKMRLAGYDPSPRRPLSLTDMLILLTVSDRSQLRTQLTPKPDRNWMAGVSEIDLTHYTLIDNLEFSLSRARRQIAAGQSPAPAGAGDASVYARHSGNLGKLIDHIDAQIQVARRVGGPVPLFSRLVHAYPDLQTARESDIRGMCDFLDAWHTCRGAFEKIKDDPNTDPTHLDPQDYPERLSRQSAGTDLLLKEAMDALTADLQAVYFQPLLDWIREDVRGGHAGDTGIDLVGTTSLTVRDRTLAETKGQAESFFKFTPIPHLTMDTLTGAKTLANGAAATPDTTTQTVATDAGGIVRDHTGSPVVLTPGQQLALDPATGLALRKGSKPDDDPLILTVPSAAQTKSPSALATTVFGVLAPLQALALQAALNEDATVPTYRSIAPGTSLAIRPFVLPDGGSARLQMSLTSCVEPDQPDAGRRAAGDLPFDVITSHTVTTEATISAFDLQTIASFGAQTTAPGDYAWRIPLLDQIPLLGALFHGPRAPETKRQDSIAIVNLTILPRSLDLVPYYVASPKP